MADYIKREDAIKEFENRESYSATYVRGFLKHLPSADVQEVRHGRWIESTTDLICSACGTVFNDELPYMCREFFYGNPKYCPYCGAKMDE